MKVNPALNLFFTSNINVVTLERFKEKIKEDNVDKNSENYIGKPWNRMIIANEKGYTERAFECIAGGVASLGSSRFGLFHYWPGNPQRYSFDKSNGLGSEIKSKAQAVKNNELRGFIAGGRSYACRNPEDNEDDCMSDAALMFTKQIEDKFEEEEIRYSKIWGIKDYDEFTNIYYNADEDTWYLARDKNEPYWSNHHPGLTFKPIENFDDLKKRYDVIEIDKGDTLYINDKEVDPSLY